MNVGVYAARVRASVVYQHGYRREAIEGGQNKRTPVPYSSDIVGFASRPESERVCLHRSGRWGREHAWDRDGRCCFCTEVRRV